MAELPSQLSHDLHLSTISIETTTNGIDADNPPGPFIQVGQIVNWTYDIENIGNVPITNMSVTDDQGTVVVCPEDTIALGTIMSCTASGIAQLRQYVNIGTVNGTDPYDIKVEFSDPSHYYGGN